MPRNERMVPHRKFHSQPAAAAVAGGVVGHSH